MSIRKRGARTGMTKPREIEAQLLAEQWRENGGALGADVDLPGFSGEPFALAGCQS